MPIIIAVVVLVALSGVVYFFSSRPADAPTDVMPTTVTPATPTAPTQTPTEMGDGMSEPTTSIEQESTTSVTPPVAEDVSTLPVGELIETGANGSFTAETSYLTPARKSHGMNVTLTLKNNVVTDAAITYDSSTQYQERFDEAYKAEVIGKPIENIKLSRVGGASLTTNAFNEAVVKIQAQL